MAVLAGVVPVASGQGSDVAVLALVVLAVSGRGSDLVDLTRVVLGLDRGADVAVPVVLSPDAIDLGSMAPAVLILAVMDANLDYSRLTAMLSFLANSHLDPVQTPPNPGGLNLAPVALTLDDFALMGAFLADPNLIPVDAFLGVLNLFQIVSNLILPVLLPYVHQPAMAFALLHPATVNLPQLLLPEPLLQS